MSVPFLDLGAVEEELGDAVDAAISRVRRSGAFVLGPEVEAFEAEFAAYAGARHAVGVASGLDALQLLLRADGIGPGDEVLVPAYTAIATWMAVDLAGARPVGVDVHRSTWTMDAAAAEAAVTARTRAVIPVHLFGQPADMDAFEALGARHGLRVYEDAAQAHGARWAGRRAGGLARAAAFSFYPTKNLGALGDGGAVTTDDAALAARLRLLRSYGWRERSRSEIKGLNSRLDELQAAILRVKLAALDDWNARRRTLAARYREGLEGAVELVGVAARAEPVWHLLVARVDDRDEVRERLEAERIGALVHYDPLPHLTAAYRADGWRSGDFPVAEAHADRALSLPMYPQLDPAGVDRVIAALRRATGDAFREPEAGA